jgi:hypothetical protein
MDGKKLSLIAADMNKNMQLFSYKPKGKQKYEA